MESVQPVIQLLTAFWAEDKILWPLRWGVDDRQPSSFVTRRVLFNHTDPSVLQHKEKELKTGAAAGKLQLCVERNIADAAEKQQQNEKIHSAVLFWAQ